MLSNRSTECRRRGSMLVWAGPLLSVLLLASCAAVESAVPPSTEIRIAAVGDIMLGGTAAPELARYGYDYPFEHVGPLLRSAQLAFGNLEGPLTNGGQPATTKQYVFRSPPDKVAPALARAGIGIVSLANNHSMDFGIDGLNDTIAALEQNGIRHVGAGADLAQARSAQILTLNGVRLAFLAYSLTLPEEFWAGEQRPGTAFGHEHQVRADITAARQRADIVIVSFHWGREGTTELRDYQRLLGHAAIEAGAAAVLGHHPHILQGIERYRDGVILYSLGNFVFGSYSPDAIVSVVAFLTFRDGRVSELRLHPLYVKNVDVVFQPRPLSGADADDVVAMLQQLSAPLGVQFENQAGIALFRPAPRS